MGYRTAREPGKSARIVRVPTRPTFHTTRTFRLDRRDDGVYMRAISEQDTDWVRGTNFALPGTQLGCELGPDSQSSLSPDA